MPVALLKSQKKSNSMTIMGVVTLMQLQETLPQSGRHQDQDASNGRDASQSIDASNSRDASKSKTTSLRWKASDSRTPAQ
jgi:hypothetical protein